MMNPFSHSPGISFLLPGSVYEVQVFPTLICFYDLTTTERKKVKEIALEVDGPLSDFTVLQDLQRGCISVICDKLRFHILPNCELVYEKKSHLPLIAKEELFLGSHKKKEWESIKKRLDFCEIFPIWQRLGSLLSLPEAHSEKGMFSLLNEVQAAIAAKKPEKILFFFKKLFLAGFKGAMVPRLNDDEHQGIVKEEETEISPLYLLSQGAELISSLFFTFDGKKVSILPNLPPQFFSGSFKNIGFQWGILDLEWSKKMVRSLTFRCQIEGEAFFNFDSSIETFRLRENLQEKGRVLNAKNGFLVEKGKTYLLDRFTK